jgi:hypothetical protein
MYHLQAVLILSIIVFLPVESTAQSQEEQFKDSKTINLSNIEQEIIDITTQFTNFTSEIGSSLSTKDSGIKKNEIDEVGRVSANVEIIAGDSGADRKYVFNFTNASSHSTSYNTVKFRDSEESREMVVSSNESIQTLQNYISQYNLSGCINDIYGTSERYNISTINTQGDIETVLNDVCFSNTDGSLIDEYISKLADKISPGEQNKINITKLEAIDTVSKRFDINITQYTIVIETMDDGYAIKVKSDTKETTYEEIEVMLDWKTGEVTSSTVKKSNRGLLSFFGN